MILTLLIVRDVAVGFGANFSYFLKTIPSIFCKIADRVILNQKNSMKRFLLTVTLSLLFLTFSNTTSKAQIQLGLDLGPNIPIGDFGDVAETGVGFKFIFKSFFDDNFAFMANIGYNSFDGKDNIFRNNDNFGFDIIPININAEYHFGGDKISPYLSGGLGFYSISLDNDDIFGNDDRYEDTEIGLDLGGGITYPIKDNIYLSGDLKIHLIENASFIGLNFGVLFDL